jgi:hypothetical protein
METHALDARGSFVWIADPDERLRRASTALVVERGVLVIDPVDHPDLDDALAAVGPVIGTCTLIDRHGRDAAAVAARHGVPQFVPAVLAGKGTPLVVDGVQERVILAMVGWNEAALWLPERRLLICAEAVGTLGFFLAMPDDKLGVHPLLRVRPPRDALGGLDPVAVAVGHGPPVTDGAAEALEHALETARSAVPGMVTRLVRERLPFGNG